MSDIGRGSCHARARLTTLFAARDARHEGGCAARADDLLAVLPPEVEVHDDYLDPRIARARELART